MNKTKRISYIDNLKAVLILLVILGHSIQYSEINNFEKNIIARYIYSFHMPLFMLISGYLSYKIEYTFYNIKKRFVQLVIPFVIWSVIGMVITKDWSLVWILSPDKSLWFLWILFWAYLINVLSFVSSNRLKMSPIIVIGCVYFAIFAIQKFFLIHNSGCGLLLRHLPFFCVGIYCGKYSSRVVPLMKKLSIPLLMIWAFCAYWWCWWHSPFNLHYIVGYVYNYIVAFTGSFGFWGVVQYFKTDILIFRWLGGATLGIYAIHMYILNLMIPLWSRILSNDVLVVITVFLTTATLSYCLYKLLMYSKYSRLFLLGK